LAFFSENIHEEQFKKNFPTIFLQNSWQFETENLRCDYVLKGRRGGGDVTVGNETEFLLLALYCQLKY
jgi:hypothetical protein